MSCLNNDNNRGITISDSATFELTDSVRLPAVFSNISDLRDLIYLQDNEQREYLLLLDDSALQPDKTLWVYDWKSKEVIQQLRIETEGPDGIPAISSSSNFSFFTDTPESVVFWNFASGEFIHFDLTASKVLARYDWKNLNNYNIAPFINAISPMIRQGDSEYALTLGRIAPVSKNSHFSEVPSAAIVHFIPETEKLEVKKYLFNYPAIYDEGFYGAEAYLYAVSFLKDEQDNFLVSFPIDHHIYQYHEDGKLLNKHLVKSRYLPEQIKPFREKGFLKKLAQGISTDAIDINERAEYLWTTSNYSGLFKIPGQKDLFARIVHIKPTLDEVKSTWGTGKQISKFSLLVFDRSFNVLSEQVFLMKDYSFFCYFLTNDKIYFLNYDKSVNSEEFLYFDGFSFMKK